MKYAVLDTNVFLHFQPVDQVDWRAELDADAVTLVIPRRIVTELDEQKDQNSKQKLRERARKALHHIEDVVITRDDATVRDGVVMEYAELLPAKFFEEHDLDRDTPDDHLIATALYLRAEHPDSRVLIFTDDTGPRLSAAQYNVATERPAGNLRLPSARGEEEKELRRLRLENERLKKSLPELYLAFSGEETYSKFQVVRPNVRSDKEIEEAVESLKKGYPEKKKPQVKGSLQAAFSPSEEEYERYNSERLDFFTNYAEYLKDLRDHRLLMGLVVRLDLCLFNTGSVPGEDIDIEMYFPDGFILVESEPSEPRKPSPPASPRGLGSAYQGLSSFGALSSVGNVSVPELRKNVSPPDIQQTNSYNVQVNVQTVKHHMKVSLDPLFVIFESCNAASSFQFDYSITCANHPDIIQGSLNVIIET